MMMSAVVVTELYVLTAKPNKAWHRWTTCCGNIRLHVGATDKETFSLSTVYSMLISGPVHDYLNMLSNVYVWTEPTPIYTIHTLVESKGAATTQIIPICYANI